jgi:cephalosporin-C deacetylase-like acetyl esterase
MAERCFTLRDYLERRLADFTPQFRSPPASPAAFDAWRNERVARLRDRIGTVPQAPSLNAETVRSVSFEGFRAEKVVFDSGRWFSVSAWLLLPDEASPGRRPAVVVPHGHTAISCDEGASRYVDQTTGKAWVCGLDAEGRACSTGYHNDFGQALARAGFVVLCPDMMGFGERAGDPNWLRYRFKEPCDSHSLALDFLGDTTLAAVHLNDLQKAIDYLQSRPEVDPERIGMAGCSVGGVWTAWAAAMDGRVKAAAVSNCYPNTRRMILGKKLGLCGSNVVRGMAAMAETPDVLALVAPRPLFVQVGLHDPMGQATDDIESLQVAKSVYDLLGCGEKFETELFPGGHEIKVDSMLAWLRRRLTTPEKMQAGQ